MSAPGSSVYTPSQVRELDRIAIAELGIPGYELMSRAGRFVFEATRARHPQARRWLVLCGAGNNAGDGYVVARLAAAAGIEVSVAALSDPERLVDDAGRAWRDFRAAGGQVLQFSAGLCGRAHVAIDALLGTGLARALEGAWREAVESLNSAALPVIAVDMPTGLDGETGAVLGAAVRADATATFIGRKQGLYVGAGPEYRGEILFSDLGVPLERLRQVAPCMQVFDREAHRGMLPRRRRTAHKGDFGHVVIVGGNRGMGGAVRLAGEAALRTGAGLVTVATRPDNVTVVTAGRPELMCTGIGNAAELEPILARATVAAIGPGLGRDAWAEELLAALGRCGLPLVLDADALNLLAERPAWNDSWVLTPHPGEAARLLGMTSAGVQADRPGAAREIATRFGGVCVLKGRCTLVAQAGEVPRVVDAGNPGMASAGMGDVLTGIVAGLLAQTRPADRLAASACAAFVHASAADAVARDGGERGLIAGDVLTRLRPWLNPPG
jgi:NAD(P)H-hydrate epimerase